MAFLLVTCLLAQHAHPSQTRPCHTTACAKARRARTNLSYIRAAGEGRNAQHPSTASEKQAVFGATSKDSGQPAVDGEPIKASARMPCKLNASARTRFHGLAEIVRWHEKTGVVAWRGKPDGHSRTYTLNTPSHMSVPCTRRETGQVCITPAFVAKLADSRESYLHEKEMFGRLRGVPHVQQLLHADDACLTLVIKNALSPRKSPVPTHEILPSFRHAGLQAWRKELFRRDAAALQPVFDAFARSRIYPTDLSTCCNIIRTDKNGTLVVIDFGAYFQVPMSREHELLAALAKCKADVLLSLKVHAGVAGLNRTYELSDNKGTGHQRCGKLTPYDA